MPTLLRSALLALGLCLCAMTAPSAQEASPPAEIETPLTVAATGEATPVDAAPADAVEPPAATATLPHDLSPWGMFMTADWVVKAVMVGLACASVLTWTVWLAKTLELAVSRRRARTAGAGYLRAQ